MPSEGGRATLAKRCGLALSLATGLAAVVAAAPANGTTQLGQLPNFEPNRDCPPGHHMVQSALSSGTPYQVPPEGGVITSWRVRAHDTSPGTVRLQLWQPVGGTNYTLVGRSALEAPTAGIVNQFATRILVSGGELLGRRNELGPTGGVPFGCAFSGTFGAADGYNSESSSPDPAPGETRNLGGFFPMWRTNIAAVLEPDADCDGFGDETQDGAIDPNGCDTSPPETTITARPKDKSKRRKAIFEFGSSEPNSIFECTLDGKVFQCASPLTEKVGKGKHHFQVRATDVAGNIDPTPATDDWKVKKKRKS
jgi:hypothetical protein